MAPESTSAIPVSRLTELALLRHTRAPANRLPKPARSEIDDSLPSTDISAALMDDDKDEVIMDEEEKRALLDAFRKDSVFDVKDTFMTPVRESIDPIDTRPFYRPMFLPAQAPEALPEQNMHETGTRSPSLTSVPRVTPPTMEAAAEDHPRQLTGSDRSSERIIKTTSVREGQLQNMLPPRFPPFQHVQTHEELSFFIDRSEYAISVGPGLMDGIRYGIIVVPFGAEQMLFQSEPLATPQESSLSPVDGVQPGINNSASTIVVRELFANPAPPPEVRSPPKQTRTSREKSSRIAKAARTRRPQTTILVRRSQRLGAGQRTT